ncbi:MAG: tRNA (guanosine(37)-N1)-methyltransferase TrmD [Thermodesulfobacteriota bacterium]
MKFTVLTIFPEMLDAFVSHGIIRRALERKTIAIDSVNIRDFAGGRHQETDDRPYGGGSGMVMKPEPLAAAIDAAKQDQPGAATVLLSPQGRRFDQQTAKSLAQCKGLIFVCGRYEGVDERLCEDYIDEEISIGDYVLTGGELAAMVVIDAVTRQVPGALGNADSAAMDSFSDTLLEHAHYTRPPVFGRKAIPEVLRSGNHAAIEDWRLESALIRTFLKRPDLLEQKDLSDREKAILQKWCRYLETLITA